MSGSLKVGEPVVHGVRRFGNIRRRRSGFKRAEEIFLSRGGLLLGFRLRIGLRCRCIPESSPLLNRLFLHG